MRRLLCLRRGDDAVPVCRDVVYAIEMRHVKTLTHLYRFCWTLYRGNLFRVKLLKTPDDSRIGPINASNRLHRRI